MFDCGLKRAAPPALITGLLLGLALSASVAASVRDLNLVAVAESSAEALPTVHPAWRAVEDQVALVLKEGGLGTRLFLYPRANVDPRSPCTPGPCDPAAIDAFRALTSHADSEVELLLRYTLSAQPIESAAVSRFMLRLRAEVQDAKNGAQVAVASVSEAYPCRHHQSTLDPALCVAEGLAELVRAEAEKLRLQIDEHEFSYQLRFNRFALGEFELLDRALKPEGYLNLDVTGGVGQSYAELLHTRVSHQYTFRTRLNARAVNRLLNSVVNQGGIKAQMRFANRSFQFDRQGLPYLGGYLLALAGFIAVLLVGGLGHRYRQHTLALNRAAHARDGLAYLERVAGLPWLPSWRQKAHEWRAQRGQIEAALVQARRQIGNEAFDAAEQTLATAMALDPQHPELRALQVQLPNLRQAAALITRAQAQQLAEPAAAAHALAEAMKLDPARAASVQPLLDQLHEALRRGAVHQAERQTLAAIAGGQPYTALRAVGQGIAAVAGLAGLAEEQAVLARLASQARAMLKPLRGPARGSGLLARLRIAVGEALEIGRGSAADADALGLNYKRASRLGKQTRIYRQRSGLLIEDAGSSNGSQFDGQWLAPGKAVQLAGRHELLLGGDRSAGVAGVCRIELVAHQGSVALHCDRAPTQMVDPTELAQVWPSHKEDLALVWVLLADPLPLALIGDALLPADEQTPAAVVALGYDDGYYLAPVAGAADEPAVRIGGELITTRVPISADAVITVQGRELGLQPW